MTATPVEPATWQVRDDDDFDEEQLKYLRRFADEPRNLEAMREALGLDSGPAPDDEEIVEQADGAKYEGRQQVDRRKDVGHASHRHTLVQDRNPAISYQPDQQNRQIGKHHQQITEPAARARR